LACGAILIALGAAFVAHQVHASKRPYYLMINETGQHDFDLAFRMSLKLAEGKSGIGILDDDRRGGGRRIGQIEMVVVAEMKPKFIDEPGRDRGDQGELREVTGGPIGESQAVSRRGGRVEVAVWAAEPLIVVGGGEVIPWGE